MRENFTQNAPAKIFTLGFIGIGREKPVGIGIAKCFSD
jgi:hypothetical protein